jgi:hypothetical protein
VTHSFLFSLNYHSPYGSWRKLGDAPFFLKMAKSIRLWSVVSAAVLVVFLYWVLLDDIPWELRNVRSNSRNRESWRGGNFVDRAPVAGKPGIELYT